MDVVPDRGLLDFIDRLDVKEKKVVDISLDTEVCSTGEKKEDVWQDIVTALEDWTQRILDT